ncbi:MAG: hypothetical protein DRG78_14385 [Epsilonproteobacteria bacterium]|nr:MAG: hypothetical protein DRG78_14385 [Campylobacterota bacterium]
MENNSPFIWDKYSDQPHVIKDKSYKKEMRKKHKFDFFKMLATTIFIFPFSILTMKLFTKKNNITLDTKSFYGIGVNLDKGDAQQELIKELGVKSLIVRLPLSDIQNIDKYYEFIKSFGDDKEILINLMQTREHIENLELLKKDIVIVFKRFKDIQVEYQVGTTINRAKWGFFSVSEYLNFYKVVQDIRDINYSTINLIGPSVIDFEYHYTIRALFNNYKVKFDKLSSLLYVDRRGSPYNTQMGIFDTKNKIDMLFSLVKLSPKIKSDDIYITEVNWPLSNTAPYAPTSENECVSEDDYAKYMVEYFDIAKKTKKVSKVYWHQLISPGYGLVDNRDGKIRKTKAFYELQKMIKGSNNLI